MAEVYNNQFNTLKEEEGLRLSELMELVTKNIWWYVGITLCCLTVALCYLYKTPTLYNRTAKVMISAPASLTAASMSFIEYLPEPRMNRELNS